MANYEANLRVTADSRQVDRVADKLNQVERQLQRPKRLELGTSAAERALRGVQQGIERLNQRTRINLQVNARQAQQTITGITRQLGTLRDRTVNVAVRVRESRVGRGALAGGAASGILQGGPVGNVIGGATAGASLGGPQGAAAGAAVAAVGEVLSSGGPAASFATRAADIEKLNIALRGVTGGLEQYAQAQEEINRLSADFAAPVQQTTRSFIGLFAATKAVGLSVGDTADVIRGLSAANTALGGDAQKLDRILLATSQVFGKGKVSAEELRGQIGESLPGAFNKFAEATGRTTAQLDDDLEKGRVGLADFVLFTRKLADDYSDSAEKMASSSENAGARLATAWEKATTAVGRLLQPLGAKLQDFATSVLNAITSAANGISGLVNSAIAAAARFNQMPAFQGIFGNLQAPVGPQQGPPVPDRLRSSGALPPSIGTPGTDRAKFQPSSQAQALINAAKTLGISPIDLATIISYETSGTFSPSIWGGTGGRYMGLIQFGGPERAQYGANPNQSFEEQVQGPVVRFLQDRFRNVGRSTQGATLTDLYRTINGGNPNAPLGASDGNGTIAQHVQRMTGAHRRKALDRFFGGTAANVPYGGAQAGQDAAQGWEEQERLRRAAQEQERRRQDDLNSAATRALEIDRDRALIGQSRLDQLVIEDRFSSQILRRRLAEIDTDRQQDPAVRAAQRQNLINEFQGEAEQRQETYQQILRDIKQVETAAGDLDRRFNESFSPDLDPLQTALQEVKDELLAADRTAEDLLKTLSDLGGTLPETGAARTALGDLRARLAEANPEDLAAERLTRPLRKGLQSDARRLELERDAIRQGRGLNQAEQLALSPEFQALPQARQQELQDLARRNDLLATGNSELTRTVELTQSIGQELASGIGNAITGLITGTTTLNEALSQTLANIGQILIQNSITRLLSGISIGGTPLIPGFAEGGRPPIGRPSLVGEKGPELIVPREPSLIISNDDLFAASREALASTGSGGGDAQTDPFIETRQAIGGAVAGGTVSTSTAMAQNQTVLTTSNQILRERLLEQQQAAAAQQRSEPIDVRIDAYDPAGAGLATLQQVQVVATSTAARTQAEMLRRMRNDPTFRRGQGL